MPALWSIRTNWSVVADSGCRRHRSRQGVAGLHVALLSNLQQQSAAATDQLGEVVSVHLGPIGGSAPLRALDSDYCKQEAWSSIYSQRFCCGRALLGVIDLSCFEFNEAKPRRLSLMVQRPGST